MLDRRTLLIYGLRAALAGTCAPVLAKVALGARPWPIYIGYGVNPDIAALLEARIERTTVVLRAHYARKLEKILSEGTQPNDGQGLFALIDEFPEDGPEIQPKGRYEWVEYAQSVTISSSN